MVSLETSSLRMSSVFQVRLAGSMPGGDGFGVGIDLEAGAGDEVPFERAPLGVFVPAAIFCSLTT